MMDILSAVLLFVLGVLVGWNIREYLARKRVTAYFNQMAETAAVETMHVKTEQSGDTFIIRKQDGTFLIQVKTLEELKDFLKKEYPEVNVTMAQSEIDKMEAKS